LIGADNATPASNLIAETTTGNNDVVDSPASTNRPLRYSRRHLNTSFAFTPSAFRYTRHALTPG
jgi:hypothetical protein